MENICAQIDPTWWSAVLRSVGVWLCLTVPNAIGLYSLILALVPSRKLKYNYDINNVSVSIIGALRQLIVLRVGLNRCQNGCAAILRSKWIWTVRAQHWKRRLVRLFFIESYAWNSPMRSEWGIQCTKATLMIANMTTSFATNEQAHE